MKILIGLLLVLSLHADWKIAGEVLKASDGVSGDYFGMSVDVSSNYTVIGAPLVSMGGAVYVFRKSSNGDWEELITFDQPVMPTLPAPLETAEVTAGSFGTSVAIAESFGINSNPSMIVVGAPGTSVYYDGASITTGAVCVYAYNMMNGWGQQGTCTLGKIGIVEGAVSSFGQSVDISNWSALVHSMQGDYIESYARIIAGDPGYDKKYQNVGSASFFDYSTEDHNWTLTAFVEGYGNTDSKFANRVSIDKSTVIIGETGFDIQDPNDDPEDSTIEMIWDVGAAHYFTSTGTHIETKTPPHEETAGNHHFGYDVDIFGEYSVVSEEHRTGGTTDAALYVLKNRVFHNYIENGERGYGYSVAINNNYLAVGVFNAPAEGAVYMYSKDANGDWHTNEPFYWLDDVKLAAFGIEVALSHDTLMVGAPLKEEVKQFEFVEKPLVNPALIMYLLN